MRIGFIGLGHMGRPMALNLIKAGHAVQVYDRVATACAALVEAGARTASSVAAVVRDSDVVITMVQTGAQVSELCLEEGGIFPSLAPHALYVDCSSIDITTSQHLHQLAQQRGLAMLDAPVSGGVAAAERASLTFMVGGEASYVERAMPVLSALGKKIIHAGAAGSGVAAKICNNMILGVSMIAVSEAFVLADKLGLAPVKLFEICSQASAACWSLTQYCPWPYVLPDVPSSHDYRPGFTAQMMLKDLHLSQDAAASVAANVPLGKHATALYQQFVDGGSGQLDFSAILQLLKNEALVAPRE